MKLTDKRLIDYITNKHEGEDFDLDKFLSIDENGLLDANKLKNMPEISQKIKNFINENKKILIYGDFDCDGVSACTILYMFLKSQGANVEVFIPNRFENGYGISVDAIEEIIANYMPDLIVTVDLGITAIEEVEILKQEGIDVVITDHHLPLETVPDCLIVDPKFDCTNYGFDALCGAGVAFKLVEAMSDRKTALKYIDLCAIATVGDIVPLVGENRVIAKLGIEKINSNACLKSIRFMLNKLGIEKINSIDISFRVVPRINACGRIDNAYKMFNFLIETDDKLLEEKYKEVENDNTLRCEFIEKGNAIIDRELEKFNSKDPAIIISGEFHEGIIGILASRVCKDYNKPTLIFTQTENGTLKASGRSVEGIDLHEIIATMCDIILEFGGHKMAIGVEIDPDNFEEFKRVLFEKIESMQKTFADELQKNKYDIEITDDDLTKEFIEQLNLLEPFGYGNEKPVFMISQKSMLTENVSEKAFKHYRCFTEKNNFIVSFSGYKSSQILRTNCEKQLLVDLNLSDYKGKIQKNVMLKSVGIKSVNLKGFEEQDFMSALFNKYYSIFDFNNYQNYQVLDDIVSVIKQKFNESDFGTAIIVSNDEDMKIISELKLEKYIVSEPCKNGQNCVVVNPRQIYQLNELKAYENVIFIHKYFDEEHLYFSQKLNVYEQKSVNDMPVTLSKSREIFVKVYSLVKQFSVMQANDVLDFAYKLSFKDKSITMSQILFSLIVFMELNFLEFDDKLNNIKILNAKKMDLNSSKFYNIVE